MYTLRMLTDKPVRFLLTLAGVTLCIILILFITGVYNGVAEGSIEYIKKTEADIWVLQGYNTNIIRGTSILPADFAEVIVRDTLIKSVSPVLLFLTTVIAGKDSATVLLAGYEPGKAGGPPAIAEGRNVEKSDEIVLDRSFAAKYNIRIGEFVFIQDDRLIVTGLSSGTNAFVTQYAFVTLEYEQSIIELPGLASFFIIKARQKKDVPQIIENINRRFAGTLSIYADDRFIANNIREMESGVLPLFSAIVVIGGIVLAIILSLILSVNTLEKRRDFAVMKILGSPQWFLDKLILSQGLAITLISMIIASAAYFPMLKIIEKISPEVTAPVKLENLIYTAAAAVLLTLLSSFMSCRRTRSIYPLEVFQ